MLRKVFKTGNSLVISLPRDMLAPLGMQDGSEVSVDLDTNNHQILIKPVQLSLAGDVNEDFARQVNEFIQLYRPALEALARK